VKIEQLFTTRTIRVQSRKQNALGRLRRKLESCTEGEVAIVESVVAALLKALAEHQDK